MPFGRRSPLETLALPGVILAYKYSQFRQRRREAASRRVTERELSALHHKIDKLLNKLEESEPEPPTSQEDECVICINARATMQTSPCGHRVVCRRCFVKTIQSAVAQRLLPLRCVICRARINRLISGSGTWRIQESVSNYSVGTTQSWTAPSSSKAANIRVTQSASLYSMSSGSSNVSGMSCTSNLSNSSGVSSSTNHSSTSDNSGTSSLSSSSYGNLPHYRNHVGCGTNCLGAIPRNKQQKSLANYQQTHHNQSGHTQIISTPLLHCKRSLNHYTNKVRLNDIHRLPPIKEFRSPTKAPMPSPAHVITNPRLKFASYTTQKTKSVSPSSSLDTVPLLGNIKISNSQSNVSKLTAKVAPIKPKTPTTRTLATSPNQKLNLPSNTSTSRSSFFILSSLSRNSSNSAEKNGQKNYSVDATDSKANDKMVNENKRNEYSAEKRKKEEKLRKKAENEAKKEEKRQAKEEKKRNKKDLKYFSLLCDNNKMDSNTKSETKC